MLTRAKTLQGQSKKKSPVTMFVTGLFLKSGTPPSMNLRIESRSNLGLTGIELPALSATPLRDAQAPTRQRLTSIVASVTGLSIR